MTRSVHSSKVHCGQCRDRHIRPETASRVNGRQSTAVIWSPGYVFYANSQTSVMEHDFRVHLYECVKTHESNSENSPPNADFWRELVSQGFGHSWRNTDNSTKARDYGAQRERSRDWSRSYKFDGDACGRHWYDGRPGGRVDEASIGVGQEVKRAATAKYVDEYVQTLWFPGLVI